MHEEGRVVMLVMAIGFLLTVATIGYFAALEARQTMRTMERLRRIESAEFDDWISEQRKQTSHERLKAARKSGSAA